MDDSIDDPLLDLVEQTLARALMDAADRRLRPSERHGSAKVAAALIPFVERSERLFADVVGAATRAVDHGTACRTLLEAFRRIAPTPDYVRVTIRLIGRAEAEGHAGTVRGLMIAASSESLFFRSVDDAWMLRVLDMIRGEGAHATMLFAHVLRKAVRLVGAEHGWIRELVDEEPQVLVHPIVSVDVLLALHAAAPTVAGWRALAVKCRDPLLPISFGDHQGEAMDTLRQAVESASDTATRVTLSRWLSELIGR